MNKNNHASEQPELNKIINNTVYGISCIFAFSQINCFSIMLYERLAYWIKTAIKIDFTTIEYGVGHVKHITWSITSTLNRLSKRSGCREFEDSTEPK